MKKEKFFGYMEAMQKSLDGGKTVTINLVDESHYDITATKDERSGVYTYLVRDSMFPRWRGEYTSLEKLLKGFYLPKVISVEI